MLFDDGLLNYYSVDFVVLNLTAFLLYLTHATALVVLGVRISDVAAFAFFCIILWQGLLNKRQQVRPGQLFYFFVGMILLSLVISTGLQWLFSSGAEIYDGLSNAIVIPVCIILMLIVVLLFDFKYISELLYRYSLILLTASFCIYAFMYFFGQLDFLNYDLLFDERFSGLAKNPNQIGIYMLPLPFIFIYKYQLNGLKLSRLVVLIVLLVALNYLVAGKALFLGWILSIVLIYLLLGIKLRSEDYNLRRLFIRLSPILLLVPFASALISALFSGDIRGGQEGQGEIRLLLWFNGLNAWFDAPFLGHGPGHYSGVWGAYENMESHNFYIDWLTAYGLIGTLFLVGLFIYLIKISLHVSKIPILLLVVALIIQMSFHFLGRQPFFWIIISYAVMAARSNANSRFSN